MKYVKNKLNVKYVKNKSNLKKIVGLGIQDTDSKHVHNLFEPSIVLVPIR